MKLSELLSVLPEKRIFGNKDPEITGLVYDPLRVTPGCLYVAINIYTQLDKIEIPDGHSVLPDAVRAGAVAVVLQQDQPVPEGVVKILVPDSRHALALLAVEFYRHPARSLHLIGVTGTNGKTTTTHVIESLLTTRYRVGLIGTLYYKINGRICDSKDTTPEPPDLAAIFTEMVKEKCDFCTMEVSSHAVDFHRVVGVDYEAAAWTNLSQDHLDWHKTMENYRHAKLRWLASLDPQRHVALNNDDPSAHHFIAGVSARKVLYGIRNQADVTARDCRFSVDGTQFTLVTPRGEIGVNAKLRGEFNLYNMLAGVAAVLHTPLTLDDLKQGLEKNIAVAGRFQPVALGQPFSVIIDYAHTPGGMETVLRAARAMQPKRLITVFGCGGDRDRAKRPPMAAAAEANSDLIIITDDNPRTEDPEQIVGDMVTGLRKGQSSACQIIHNRREAIRRALDIAQPGDLVLVAGKGHESSQILKDHTIHFNDYEVAEELLRAKGYGG